MPKRRPVELTESAKKKLPAAKAAAKARDLGTGQAAKAAGGLETRRSRNRGALDAAKKSFDNARRS